MPGSFKKQSMKYLTNFKEFAENQKQKASNKKYKQCRQSAKIKHFKHKEHLQKIE